LSPLRIIYDHQLFSLQDVGGGSRYHYELIRYLSNDPDVRADLFLGLYRSAYPLHEVSSSSARVIGLRVPLPYGLVRYALNEVIESAASVFSGKYDIYHSTYFRFMPAVRSRALVATHHDCIYEQLPQLFPDAARVIRFKASLYGQAARIICISEFSRQGLLKYYDVDPGKTCVVYHGLNPLPRSLEAAKEVRGRTRRGFLLYVGNRDYHKNFLALLHAIRESRLSDEYDLLALGGGLFTEDEQNCVQALGLDACVHCLPRVTDEFLAEAYVAAALFVYPSLAEGFGRPPLEAMALGCPVAVSDATALPEVCRDAPFYFDPLDVASIARALLSGVNDAPARARAIVRGREVAAGYSWEKCGAETLAVYRECL
jgi:glycosyltransferase involved in cell wall biosynthesis